jgi:Na+/melibiose symporter and related transporters
MKKATTKEIYTYALHAFGQSFAILMSMYYFTIFLTDNLGISAALTGTILVVARFVDLVIGLSAGGIIQAQTTKGRYYSFFINIGRYCVVVGGILMFVNTSALPLIARLVLAFTGYLLLNGAMNFLAPSGMGAISDMCGSDMESRKIMSIRGAQAGIIAQFLVSLICLNAINLLTPTFGKTNSYTVVAAVFAIPFLYFAGSFRKCLIPHEAERKQATKTAPKVTFGDMIKSLGQNSQIAAYVFAASIATIGTTVISTVMPYYFRYVIKDFTMMSFVSAGSVILGFITSLIAPFVLKLVGKKWIYCLGNAIIAVGFVVIYFAKSSLTLFIVGYSLYIAGRYLYFGYNANIVQDAGEYGFWKTGKDSRAVAFGLANLPAKIGFIGGGALGTYGLAITGYVAGMTVSAEWVSKFMVLIGLVPAAIVAAAVLIFAVGYRITDADATKYAKENSERVKAHIAAAGKSATAS